MMPIPTAPCPPPVKPRRQLNGRKLYVVLLLFFGFLGYTAYFCFVKLLMGRLVVCRGWFSAAFVFGPSVFYPV